MVGPTTRTLAKRENKDGTRHISIGNLVRSLTKKFGIKEGEGMESEEF